MEDAKRDTAVRIVEAVRQLAAHYGLWLAESAHQFGVDAALAAEQEAGDRLQEILLVRLSKALDFRLEQGLPEPMLALEPERLETLLQSLSLGWLAADGVWFQALEGAFSMEDAKRVNDTCWSRMAPLEAARIKALLGLPQRPDEPLQALEQALQNRLYAAINTQEIAWEQGALVLRMKTCRVQAARRRKGLAEYPCKSGGQVEYRTFAATVDPRIRTTCLGCPPDPLAGADWHCAWRFQVDRAAE